MRKYIFCTGGVVSSVGKGITAASIGLLLRSRGISVAVQKLDPYLNVDPGTMSPYQHGEVFVTDDGAETDLDLGHYERFIDVNLSQASNVTSGQIYAAIIQQERRGDFLGGTIQVIPHITNEMKSRIAAVGRRMNADVVIAEVGGTVGDIEGLPFLEAIRQMRKDAGPGNSLYVHLTLLPYIAATRELKTKPTQHSVMELRRVGIHPDVIVCRSDYPISEEIREKIALFCDVDAEAVIPLVTMPSIYQVPLHMEGVGLGRLIVQRLGLPDQEPDLAEWSRLVENMALPKPEIEIALVGKYVDLRDAYISVCEALRHAGLHHGVELKLRWINSEDVPRHNPAAVLQGVRGIVVPGGFGHRGIEGKIAAAGYARRHNIPYLGLCLGMQCAVIEFAREVLDAPDANSTEFDPRTSAPVIDLMADQRDIYEKGGTMRLGAYPCRLVPGTRVAEAYAEEQVDERHRHRFEFNNRFRQALQEAGLVVAGTSPDGRLVEIVELRDHPWFVGTQFHPEFRSRPTRPHPLFRDFIGVALKQVPAGGQHPLPLDED
ncbi:MAG: CTP synthase [Chloroflexia bacterium]|nr:CTP synthase [Chloroflexia bacterium]